MLFQYSLQETVRRLSGGVKKISVGKYLKRLPRGVWLLKINHEKLKRNACIRIGDEVTLGMKSLEANHKAAAIPLY